MQCSIHSECEHQREAWCDCAKCWKFEHQCEYAYDAANISERIGDENTGIVAARRQQRELADDIKRKGYNNLYCTETLHNSITTPTWKKTYNEGTNTRDQELSPKSTQLSIRSGASTPIGFHFPDPGSGEWERYIYNLNEYKQSKDKKRFIERFIRDCRTKLQTDKNMDRNWQRGRSGDKPTNDNERRNDTSNNGSETIDSGPNGELQSNMENEEKIHNNGTSSRGKRKQSGTTEKSRGKTRRIEIENEIIESTDGLEKISEQSEKSYEQTNENGDNNDERGDETSIRYGRRNITSVRNIIGRREGETGKQTNYK